MIEIEKIKEICKGKFLSLKEVFYEYKGKKKRWEVCNSMDSVSCLIYAKDKDALVFVKQFRLPVYLKNQNGFTYELCAGLCDKNLSSIDTIREEILEEVGYKVENREIEFITSTWASVGTNAARQEVFYVEVDESKRVNEGGGLEDEDIEVVFVPVKEIEDFLFDENIVITPGAKMAVLWWLNYKKEKK
jgi:UDP-sugar diphosphatase